jgi:2-dehydropantoate 2-reductase
MSKGSVNPLRVLTFGAGAIGTYIGGSLALRGHTVVFLELEKNISLLRQQGLHLHLLDGKFLLPAPQVFSRLEEALEAGPFDVALFALKSFDTQGALDTLRPFAADLPPFLCLQNGVDNEARIAEVLGPSRVLAGTITSAIERRRVGDIQLQRLRGMGIAAGHPLADVLVTALNDAGLNARLFPSAADMKWSKLLTNILANASAAILNMTPAEIFSHPGLYRLEVAQFREALEVIRALRLHVVDLPGTPVRLLALLVRRLPASLSRPLLARALGQGRGGKMPSFHIDLYGGRGKSEVTFLNGAIVRHGQQVGVHTPINQLLTDLLTQLTRGDIPLETYARQPEKLLALANRVS